VTATAVAAAQLVRLSTEHPTWHLQRPGEDRTACGRVLGPATEARSPWPRLDRPGPICSRCGSEIEALDLDAPAAAEASAAAVPQATLAEVDVDLLDAAPDNPRGSDFGDLTELADSIRAQGVLQPLTVTPRGERYLIVYGHRRYAAAILADRGSVPAIVRDLSEVQRVAWMMVENLQREDLTPLQEAEGYRHLQETHQTETGKALGQQQLARMVGKSQGHVSKRLTLLELPTQARDALDSGGITVTQGLELHKLVDVGLTDRAAELAVQQAHGKLQSWQPLDQVVKEDLNRLALDRKAEQTRADLQAKGITLLQEPKGGWYNRAPRPLVGEDHQGCLYVHPLVQVPLDEHAALSCHAAAVCPHGETVWMCRDPKLHAEQDPRAAEAADRVATREREDAERRERDRALTAAARARADQCRALLTHEALASYDPSEEFDDVLCTLLARLEVNVAKAACKLLGLDPVEEPQSYGSGTYKNYRRALKQLADDAATRDRAARAVVLAHAEEHLRIGWGSWTGRVADRHLATLQAAGYQLSPAEQAKLDADRAEARAEPQPPDLEPSCRCGDALADHDEQTGACAIEDCTCPSYRPDDEDLDDAADQEAAP